jgi:hypothetical protein
MALGQGPQVGKERDGGVVLGGFTCGDHRVDAGPGGFFVAGQFV